MEGAKVSARVRKTKKKRHLEKALPISAAICSELEKKKQKKKPKKKQKKKEEQWRLDEPMLQKDEGPASWVHAIPPPEFVSLHGHSGNNLVIYTDGVEEILNLKRDQREPVNYVAPNQGKETRAPANDSSNVHEEMISAMKDYGEELVGCCVKVWRSKSNTSSEGVVASYDVPCKKHLDMSSDLTIPSPSSIVSKLPTLPGDDGLVNINGYKVKPTTAPILEAIFAKHGDIMSHCSYKSTSVRASLLEVICNIVHN